MSDDINNQPIGVFDSGVGGLTVAKEITKIMPHENIIYFGDTARLPYGSKSESTIIKFSLENTIFLHTKNVKTIVIACNTASAVSLDYLRNFIRIPILGVIECGALGAVKATKTKKVAVIGTKTTINSSAYSNALIKLDKSIEVKEISTPLLVHLVEENWIDRDITKSILIEYLSPLIDSDFDTLILGCTHYPLLIDKIHDIVKDINIIDSSKETSHFLLNTLLNLNILSKDKNQGSIQLCLSDPHPNSLKWAEELLDNSSKIEIIDYIQ